MKRFTFYRLDDFKGGWRVLYGLAKGTFLVAQSEPVPILVESQLLALVRAVRLTVSNCNVLVDAPRDFEEGAPLPEFGLDGRGDRLSVLLIDRPGASRMVGGLCTELVGNV